MFLAEKFETGSDLNASPFPPQPSESGHLWLAFGHCQKQDLTSASYEVLAKMEYLKRSAASDYLNMSRLALRVDQITPYQFLSRLVCLKAMSKPSSPEHSNASIILRAEGWLDDEGWIEEGQVSDSSHNDYYLAGNGEAGLRDGGLDPDDPLYVYLVVTISGTRWKFIVGDPDPWPSVPHGHGWNDARWKIDPYLGDTFFQGRSKGRVPRSELVAFWNNDKFRDYARSEIEHWIEQHKGWTWRVSHPARLPRRSR